MPLQVEIITPQGVVLALDDAEHVLLPGTEGQLGILPGHIPMVSSLTIGRIEIDHQGRTIRLSTSGGFAEVTPDRVVVLAETAEKAEDIDVERARRALERARKKLRQAAEMDEAVLRAALARALNRLSVAGEQV